MVTRKDYNKIAVQAAHAVLLEIIRVLGEYRESIVLVGGWVPQLLFKDKGDLHTGSIDVDLALNHRKITDEGYKSIHDLLVERGYQPGKQPFIFHRLITISGAEIKVQVDLLSGEYEGSGKSHRHQRIQQIHARKVRGCDLAFNHPIELTIDGNLPGGAKDSAVIQVASIVPFLIMKAIVLDDRMKEKDAYDIYYCLRQYGDKLDKLVAEFKPYMENGLVKEGLEKLAKNFSNIGHIGPKFVSAFEEVTEGEERVMLERDAFERVNYLLQKLGVV